MIIIIKYKTRYEEEEDELLGEVKKFAITPEGEAGICEESLAWQAKKIVVVLIVVLACVAVFGCVSRVDPYGNPVQPPTMSPRPVLSTPTPTASTSESWIREEAEDRMCLQSSESGQPTITPTPSPSSPASLGGVALVTPTPTPTSPAILPTPPSRPPMGLVTPTPTPTPLVPEDPFSREKHRTVDLVPVHAYDGTEPGVLVWDPSHSRGLYSYYSHGDHAVVALRFVNTIPKPIERPVVVVEVKKDVLGALATIASWRWVENTTIPGASDDNPTPVFTPVLEYDVPDTIPPGDYVLEATILVDDEKACWISHAITIYD